MPAAPNPQNNLLLYGVLGVGAYLLLARRAGAAPLPGAPGADPAAALGQAAGALTNALKGLSGIFSGPAPITTPNANWSPSVNQAGANNPSAYIAPSTYTDSLPFNPTDSAASSPYSSDADWAWWN